MSSNPAYTNNGQNAQYHPSGQPSSQHLTPYSTTPPTQAYQTPHSTMSQSAYAYYQQQQGYGHAAPVQSSAATPIPVPYAYRGYSAPPGHANLPQTSTAVHQLQPGFLSAQQTAYAGYGGAAYHQTPPQLYPQYPEHGQGVSTVYAHQRHGSSSTVASSPSQSSQSSSSSSDRFPCPNCDKSFTRNFDRKRHMEIHLPGSSGSNRCRYCHKDYSRPDSLKRHLDNGCEKKPRS